MSTRTTTARRSHAAAPRRSRAIAPSIPRRISGPVARPVTAGAGALPARGIPARRQSTGAFERLAALPDHRLLDRLLRGRLWIWLIGLSLGGIVAMQVSLLKLNTGISRAVQSTATLERQNSALEASLARLSSQERIQRAATALGMASPEAGQVEHVAVRPSVDGRRAARRMSAPSDAALAQLAAGHGAQAAAPGSDAQAGAGAPAGATAEAAPAATAAPTSTAADPAAPAATQPGNEAAPAHVHAPAPAAPTGAVVAPAPGMAVAPAPGAAGLQG